MLNTSARASKSSLATSVAPTSAARASVRFWLHAITSISNARPTLATREPSPPSPMTPSIFPFKPSPQLTCHRSEEHTSELQSLAYLVCRLLLEKKKQKSHESPNPYQ